MTKPRFVSDLLSIDVVSGVLGSGGIPAGAGAAYADEVLADSPLAYWKMDESAGATSLADSSGNGFDMIDVRGSPTFEEPGLGGGGTSILFDSSTEDHFHRRLDNAFKVDPITVEFIYKYPDPLQTGVITLVALMPRESSNTGRGVSVKQNLDIDEWVPLLGPKNAGSWDQLNVTANQAAGKIVHVVTTFHGDNRIAIYLDGVLAGEKTTGFNGAIEWLDGGITGGAWPNPPQVYIGASRSNLDEDPDPDTIGNTEFVDGHIDEVAIYSGELSESRIQAHFDATGL